MAFPVATARHGAPPPGGEHVSDGVPDQDAVPAIGAARDRRDAAHGHVTPVDGAVPEAAVVQHVVQADATHLPAGDRRGVPRAHAEPPARPVQALQHRPHPRQEIRPGGRPGVGPDVQQPIRHLRHHCRQVSWQFAVRHPVHRQGEPDGAGVGEAGQTPPGVPQVVVVVFELPTPAGHGGDRLGHGRHVQPLQRAAGTQQRAVQVEERESGPGPTHGGPAPGPAATGPTVISWASRARRPVGR
ncbi:hypothetical protein MRQ36_31325 [Micromonospora sp. R77]|nr:hypothetical protein [Micromonospora sp. R77]MCI4066813.1 hypothetical protein [Micromonospora sp. R77]